MPSEAPAEPAPASSTAIILKAVRKTALLLLFGLLCLALLVAIWLDWITLPARSLAIAAIVFAASAPFVGTYAVLVAWMADRQSRVPVLCAGEDQQTLSVKKMSRSEFGRAEVEGSLGTRRTPNGTCYVAEDYRIEQRERVDPETGEVETVPQPVLEATWEGFVSPLEFMEAVTAYTEAKKNLVPLLQEALEAKAGADTAVMKNTDRFALGLLHGAEQDTFFEDPGDAFDWESSAGIDMEEMAKDVDDRRADDLGSEGDGLRADHADVADVEEAVGDD